MASPAAEETVLSTSDDASIGLLHLLRAGATVHFVHHVDVCSAAPEDLVADLQPVPGTDLAEDGYNSIWYFYCPKRFKNTQGKPSGHRQRAIAGGDTCWHSEAGPKPFKGLTDGATFCNLSFGRKEGSSGRSFNRMGWCMTEYDDKSGGGGDHVLCKVHRSSSSLAKGKLKSKRKATGEHPQAPPSKMSLCASVDDQVDHHQLQQQQPLLTGDHQMTMPPESFPVDYESLFPDEEQQLHQQNSMFLVEEQQFQQNAMFQAEEHQQLQQNTMFPGEGEQQFEENTLFSMDELLRVCSPDNKDELSSGPMYGGEYGSCFPGDKFTMDDLLSGYTGCCDTPKAMAPPDAVFFEGLAF